MNINDLNSEVNSATYSLIGEFLFEKVSEYREKYQLDFEEYGDDEVIGNYFFMHNFSLTFIKEYEKNKNSRFVSDSLFFINELGKSTNLEILNILRVGILETLYSTSSVRENVRILLHGSSKNIFEELSKYFN